MSDRPFIVSRDGDMHWKIVTAFLREPPHPATMTAARLSKRKSHGIRRSEANELARALNEWAELQKNR